MEELYLETPVGAMPIEEKIVQKFNLKKGTFSPFTINRIVGKNGEFPSGDEEGQSADETNNSLRKGPEAGVVELDNGLLLSTSEILDIAQGTDSATE